MYGILSPGDGIHVRRKRDPSDMSKLIFFDIDGTLAMPGTSPSEETAGAIRAARAAGHRAFICTGRGVELVGDDISSIGFDGGIYHAGGQAILDGKLVYENASDPAMVDELLPVITKYASFYTIETEAGDFNSEFDPEILSRINLDHANTELQRMIHLVLTQKHFPASAYRGEKVYKIFFFLEHMEDYLAIEKQIGPDYLAVSFQNMTSDMPIFGAEICRKDVNKGSAIEGVCRYLGADIADTIAFGDSMNDMAMIRAAGLSVAMGNSEQRIKDAADIVCESCADNGIAKELERLGLTRP